MPAETTTSWQPGIDLPCILPFGETGILAISLRAEWLKADADGNPLLLPPAIRALDRLRATFARQSEMTPGFIVSLREAIRLTQEQFANMLGVSKMTVSRWECGRMRPSSSVVASICELQRQAQSEGVKIDGGAPARRRRSA